jgi:hypothetical protein
MSIPSGPTSRLLRHLTTVGPEVFFLEDIGTRSEVHRENKGRNIASRAYQMC